MPKLWDFKQFIEFTNLTNSGVLLVSGKHGIEKESLRITNDGLLSRRNHSLGLGSSLMHPHITTDFSEGLLEFVTAPFTDPKKTLEQLHQIHCFVARRLEGDFLWTQSMPGSLETNAILLAQYGTSNLGRYKSLYREGLSYRYGKQMQMIAGVHYNFSFGEELLSRLHEFFSQGESYRAFVDTCYFALLRNFFRYQWLLVYLFGASPCLDSSFFEHSPLEELEHWKQHTRFGRFSTSLRMSQIGYSNHKREGLFFSHNSLQEFIHDLRAATVRNNPDFSRLGVYRNGKRIQINTNILQIENEYYASVRPKQIILGDETMSMAMESRGVGYIEVRLLDIDPFSPVGVDEEQLAFYQLFLLYCLAKESSIMSSDEYQLAERNKGQVALRGRDPELELTVKAGSKKVHAVGEEVLEEMELLIKLFPNDVQYMYTELLSKQRLKLQDSTNTPSSVFLKHLFSSKKEYSEFGFERARQVTELFKTASLALDTEEYFEALVKKSIQQQESLEKSDKVSFDDYIKLKSTFSHSI
ncbi:MAG: glutamate--cysteine ligase [bacterium]